MYIYIIYIYLYVYIYTHTHKLSHLVHLLRCNHCWFLSYRTKYLLTFSSSILSVTCASIKKVLPKFSLQEHTQRNLHRIHILSFIMTCSYNKNFNRFAILITRLVIDDRTS